MRSAAAAAAAGCPPPQAPRPGPPLLLCVYNGHRTEFACSLFPSHHALPPADRACSYLGLAAVEAALAQAAAAPNLRVVELDLSSNGLDALPAGLSAAAPPFANLRRLRAKYNCMTRLPVEQLVALPRLEAVDLEGNQIVALEEGALPVLPTLRRLNLAGNGLVALPDSVGRCRMLEALTLSNNPLTQLPDTLAACPITHLDVSSCRLLSLPAALATCKTLQRFFCQVGVQRRMLLAVVRAMSPDGHESRQSGAAPIVGGAEEGMTAGGVKALPFILSMRCAAPSMVGFRKFKEAFSYNA